MGTNVRSPPTWPIIPIVSLAESAVTCSTASPPRARDFPSPKTTSLPPPKLSLSRRTRRRRNEQLVSLGTPRREDQADFYIGVQCQGSLDKSVPSCCLLSLVACMHAACSFEPRFPI